ncbi:MAG: chemotaxis protein CheW [Curvibacter sp.]|nr:MAG: chemotaxis protein CheW [Curvibacter sp.]
MEVAPDVLLQNPNQREVGRIEAHAAQYLTMRLGTEEYALEILRVQEIRSYEQPVRMVQSPSFVKGVINLRGVIVPIVDLRLKLQLHNAEYNNSTVVIILRLQSAVVGAVVDGVSDVVSLSSQSIKPAPHFESQLDPGCIVGLAQLGERMLVVVNINMLMAH